MPEQLKRQTDNQTEFGGDSIRVRAFMLKALAGKPAVIVPATDEQPEDFTEDVFEDALDKVSRPTGRGKFAHFRTSSEEFARRKQEEIDLEERDR